MPFGDENSRKMLAIGVRKCFRRKLRYPGAGETVMEAEVSDARPKHHITIWRVVRWIGFIANLNVIGWILAEAAYIISYSGFEAVTRRWVFDDEALFIIASSILWSYFVVVRRLRLHLFGLLVAIIASTSLYLNGLLLSVDACERRHAYEILASPHMLDGPCAFLPAPTITAYALLVWILISVLLGVRHFWKIASARLTQAAQQ